MEEENINIKVKDEIDENTKNKESKENNNNDTTIPVSLLSNEKKKQTKRNSLLNHKISIASNNEKDYIEKIKQGHGLSQQQALKKLCWVSLICIFFMGVEIAGGILSASLAILSDAAHMFSDFSGFAISLISIYISKRKPNERMSFGYYRAEVLGALCSVLIIWVLTAWLVWEGIQRVMSNKYEIIGNIMLIVAIIGLVCNILMGQILHSHVRKSKLNIVLNHLGRTWSQPWT